MIGFCFAACAMALLASWQTEPIPEKIRTTLEEGQSVQAESLLRDYLAVDRDGARFAAVIRLASDWERSFSWDHRIWVFEQLAKLYPNWPGSGVNLANALRQVGRYERSEAVFQEWIGRFPQESGMRNDLGLLYQAQGRHDAAETEFREAMRLGNEDAPANLAVLWGLRGRIESSRQAIEGILQTHPRSAWARSCYGIWRLNRGRDG